MWHKFITTPFGADIGWLLVFGLLAVCVWVKRKAIAAVTQAVSDRCWGYVRHQLGTEANKAMPASTERTYKGAFRGCMQYENYPHEYFFELVDGKMTTKVPIFQTNLLSAIQNGALVEIDTQVGLGRRAELVLRVRVLEDKRLWGLT